jgi:metal-dependent amidase/aminoacylase/carboxypeptidase family protein
MPIVNRIAEFHAEMTEWRHQIHAHPETAFEENKTAAFVAERLASFGITFERGIAGTGVIGTLKGSAERRHAIALRAGVPKRCRAAARNRFGCRFSRGNVSRNPITSGSEATPRKSSP